VVELSFIDLRGNRQTWQIKDEPKPHNDGSDVCARLILSADGREAALQKWVPAEIATQRPSACDSLENEVRVGYRLLDRFIEGHPAEIVEVLGHDLDAAEPFLLAKRPRGLQVKDVAGQLSLDEQDEFEKGLFRALHCLAAIGVVHGDLSPLTVHWDQEKATVQLSDFGYAALVGDPVPPRVAATVISGWVRPPARRLAAHGDDIWAAGQLVLYAITGRADPAELSSRGPALRSLLDGVFADPVDTRPHASALLGRLSARPHVMAPRTEDDERFEEGRRKFDETLTQKQLPQRQRTAYGVDATGNTWIDRVLGIFGLAARPSRQVLLVAAGVAMVVIVLAVFAVWGS
jgi:hypothetical protein